MSLQTIALPNKSIVEMAVLSADIQNSTKLSAQLREQLNEALLGFAENHLSGIAPITVVKSNGDDILVITGDVTAIPKIASRLQGAFQAEANKRHRNDLKLRMGASFGRLKLMQGIKGTADAANCDTITRAVRIQSENTDAKELWCDESVAQALIRSSERTQISVLGKKTIPNFGELTLFTVSEEAFHASLLKEITCFHQGHAIQYWCIASWLHRAFKDAMPSEMSSATDKELAELTKRKKALQDFLRTSLQQAALGTFHMLQGYFASRLIAFGGNTPRICLKGFDDEMMVIDLARESGVLAAPVLQSDNSGFNHVVKTGSPYLCNDLLTELENYQNPRLKRKKVNKIREKLEKGKYQFDQQEWVKCWGDGPENHSGCYRSTLIVPLTLKNNKGILPEFKQVFGGGIDDERMIYGTLCFDHVEPHFFRHEDIDIAYVTADWLSLYLLTQINFTNGSNTFKKFAALGKK